MLSATEPPVHVRHRPFWGYLQLGIGLACFLWAWWAQTGNGLLAFLGLTQSFFGVALLANPAIYIGTETFEIRTAFGGLSKSYSLAEGVVVDGQALYIGAERVVYYAWLIHRADWQQALVYLRQLEQRGGLDMSKHLIVER